MNNSIKDLIIIGSGPSSLAAAVYTARENISTVVYEKGAMGGLTATIDMIDNYPGFEDGIEGLKLIEKMQKQAERFGAEVDFGEATAVKSDSDSKIVAIDGQEVRSRAVLIATGSNYRKLNIPGEAENYGRGVHYCATCDGAFYRGKRLVVIGGGNSAFQEAIFLTKFAEHIDLLVHGQITASDILQHDMQTYIKESKVSLHEGIKPSQILAENGRVVSVEAIKDGATVSFQTDGVFVFVGLKPNTDFLAGSGVELDENGLVKVDQKLETSVPGVFASGDVRSGAIKQIATAVGDGVVAAFSIREYLGRREWSI